MKKVTTTQIVIGGILLYLFFRSRSTSSGGTAPVRPMDTRAKQTKMYPTTDLQPDVNQISGAWEINCYHRVI